MASRVVKQKNLNLALLATWLVKQTYSNKSVVLYTKYAKFNPRLVHFNARAFLAQTSSHVFDITDIGQCGKNA